jgi:transcription initiation factor TFIIE subunit beta
MIIYVSEFHDLWHNLRTPNDVDLLKSLASEGLQATASAPKAPTSVGTGAGGKGKKGKRGTGRQRGTKITNVHLKGEMGF